MSDKPRKEPVALGSALQAWATRNGMTRRFDLAGAVDQWAEAVGPQIAAVTRALAVTPDGTLMVRVLTHAWASELGLMAPRILTRLNGNKRGRILHIRWQVGPLDQP